jgi:uncharacterized protein
MLEILEMRRPEIDDLLKSAGYGHLACSENDHPYVVPIHFAYAEPEIYIYTTAGMKTKIIDHNPNVCLQAEEFLETGGWRSVVVVGEAHAITDRGERERAVEILRELNPTLLPALAIKWSNDWMRKNVEVVYKLTITNATGLFTSEVRIAAAAARPDLYRTSFII